MLKKSCAFILSIALAMGILVHGSFAWVHPSMTSLDSIMEGIHYTSDGAFLISDFKERIKTEITPFSHVCLSTTYYGSPRKDILCFWVSESGTFAFSGGWYLSEPSVTCYFTKYSGSSRNYQSGTGSYISGTTAVSLSGLPGYWYSINGNSNTNFDFRNSDDCMFTNKEMLYAGSTYGINLDLGSYNPDTRYLDAYVSGSTYGNVRFLAIQTDDVVLSSTWVSIRYHDQYGSGTFIKDYPFDFTTSDGYSIIRINPDEISHSEFTVESILYCGSSSWGTKELIGLSLTFNEDVFPSPVPSAYPIPDYSYYDTTYINYNGGSINVIYTPLSIELHYGHTDSDLSLSYFEDYHQTPSQNVSYLVQPFSFSYIVIPAAARLNGQYYDDFLEDVVYQYDVVLDNLAYHNNPNDFDLFYGSGAWSDLTSDLAVALQQGQLDVSSVLDAWYSSHDPLLLQSPFYLNGESVIVDYVGDCSMILTDSFFFKQINYLIGDTSDILTELSERFFKVNGFSDSLFQNLSSLYNLNLQFYDSALQQLSGLSYWLNENDISNNLVDILGALSSMDLYLSSVDGKLNYLVTIDSDLNDLLEWFQNQEDSDVVLTLPDFNPSILINIYGTNIGDFVEFVQDFVNTLPEFDFSDFPNFFDYAAELVDDTAGLGNDLIGSLFNPYDYDDSGLHEFGWD